MNDLATQIKHFILEEIQPRLELLEISPDSIDKNFDLIDSGTLDSIGFINLVGAVENRFNFEIDFEELEPSVFTNLDGFVRSAVTRAESS